MMKISAYKNGKEIKFATVENPEGKDTLNTAQALIDAHASFNSIGLNYDDVRVEFVRVSVSVMDLEMLFMTPCDDDTIAIEKANEAIAAEIAAEVKATRSL